MNAVEIIALVIAIVILLKVLMLLVIKPKSFLGMLEKVYKQRTLMSAIYLVLIVVTTYYLLQHLTIVEILAASMFGVFLIGLALIQYPKRMMRFFNQVLKNKEKMWLSWILWIVAAVWVLIELFA
jgi:hypothetical protein